MPETTIRLLQPGDEAALEAFLLPRMASSMFLISNLRAAGLVYQGELYQAVYAAAFEDGQIVGVVAHTWTENLLLQAPVQIAALVWTAVKATNRAIRGVVGPDILWRKRRSNMAKLEIIDSGILYINPDPAHYHVFASHAHPLQLSAREWIATYQRGDGMYAANVNIALTRSLDGGVTWQHEGFIHDKADDDRPYSYHDGFLSRLSDGTLVIFTFRADRSRPDQPMFSPSGGLIANEPVLFFSQDNGHTWSQPQPTILPPGLVATPASTITELADGRWLATFDQWHGYDDDRPYQPIMLAMTSADRGHTWSPLQTMADGAPVGKGFWHGKTIRLNDDRLFTLYWAADMTQPDKGPVNLPIHYAITDPDATIWPMPQPTNLPGQTNWPAQLPAPQGHPTLAAIYTLREAEQPGFMVALSTDLGQSWDLDNQVRLWDATGWTHIGLSSPDKYPRSHDTIAFGAPTLMTTAEGELYASWWCTYASLTHIRWARLKVQGKK